MLTINNRTSNGCLFRAKWRFLKEIFDPIAFRYLNIIVFFPFDCNNSSVKTFVVQIVIC